MTPQQANELLRTTMERAYKSLASAAMCQTRDGEAAWIAMGEALKATADCAPAPTEPAVDREPIEDFVKRMLHAKSGAICPMCGQMGMHNHTTAEVLIYRNGLKHGLWRQEQDRGVGQGAAQAAEDDAGAIGDSGRVGANEHHEHRAGQSVGQYGSSGQDSGSTGLSGAVPVQTETVVATPASPAVPAEPWGWAIRGTILREQFQLHEASDPAARKYYDYVSKYRYNGEAVHEIKPLYEHPAVQAVPAPAPLAPMQKLDYTNYSAPVTMSNSADLPQASQPTSTSEAVNLLVEEAKRVMGQDGGAEGRDNQSPEQSK